MIAVNTQIIVTTNRPASHFQRFEGGYVYADVSIAIQSKLKPVIRPMNIKAKDILFIAPPSI
jgi:hypothetical protein